MTTCCRPLTSDVCRQVELRFKKAQRSPGSKATLQLTASPGSLCSIVAVDKSVTLLGGGGDGAISLSLESVRVPPLNRPSTPKYFALYLFIILFYLYLKNSKRTRNQVQVHILVCTKYSSTSRTDRSGARTSIISVRIIDECLP